MLALFTALLISQASLSGPAKEKHVSAVNTPESAGAKPLLDTASFPKKYQVALSQVKLSLTDEDPADFFVTIVDDPKAPEIMFHLWHKSAFSPYPIAPGNPGGKCRTVHFSRQAGKISKTLFWQ